MDRFRRSNIEWLGITNLVDAAGRMTVIDTGKPPDFPRSGKGAPKPKGRIGVSRGKYPSAEGQCAAPKISPDQPGRASAPRGAVIYDGLTTVESGTLVLGADSILGDPKGAVIGLGGLAVQPEGTVDLSAIHPSATDPERDFPQEGSDESRPEPPPQAEPGETENGAGPPP
jgi:hypothetical protein